MSVRDNMTYETHPKYERYIQDGYRPVKDYGDFELFEKVAGDKVLYRECFGKFDLYGAQWSRNRGVSEYEKHARIRNI